MVLSIEEKKFHMTQIDDADKAVGTSFKMTEKDLAINMRLTHAFTYFSAQARTIYGPLRLYQTDHPHFTLRHLIVGLGRAPNGASVEVM